MANRDIGERTSTRIEDTLAKVEGDVRVITSHIDALKEAVEKLVTRAEFAPVKLLVYGLAGSTLAGVVGAIMSKVLVK